MSPQHRSSTRDAAFAILVARRMAGTTVRNAGAYLATVRGDVANLHRQRARETLDAHPDLTVEELVSILEAHEPNATCNATPNSTPKPATSSPPGPPSLPDWTGRAAAAAHEPPVDRDLARRRIAAIRADLEERHA